MELKVPGKTRKTGKHRPTIRDVAQEAGVSTATVSHVLNNTGRASAKTHERVSAAIAKLGFRPNGNAASLRNRRSKLIGLVLPTFTNPFFARMACEFEACANAEGYDIVTVTTAESPERERERINALLSRQMEALIVYPASNGEVGGGFSAHDLPPTVLMDRAVDLPEFDTVCLDNETSGYHAARHLLEAGHQSIVVLVESLSQEAMRQRATGAKRAGVDCRIVVGGTDIESLRAAVEQELRRQDRATAIIATSNVATLGAIKAIQGLQLKMPDDISLVGYDDFDWMTALRPYVSAISQPMKELATVAWRLLMKQIEARHDAGRFADVEHVIVAGELKIRESSGKPRPN
jgi:LacI family transcriptional regulator